MDLVSFGACLRRVLQRKQEEILSQAINMRMAMNADAKAFKKWVKGMERNIGAADQTDGAAFMAAVSSGKIKGAIQ